MPCTVPTKRYPWLPTVSMKRELAASSCKAARSLRIATFRHKSPSTKVSGQIVRMISCRETSCFGRDSRRASIWNGLSCSGAFTPCLKSSPLARFATNSPKRRRFDFGVSAMDAPAQRTLPPLENRSDEIRGTAKYHILRAVQPEPRNPLVIQR